MLRYAALLDATEALLRDHGLDEIGLYQIAEKAEVPPPSVYHFFPTREAAFEALAGRYADGLMTVHDEPIPARLITRWEDLYQIDTGRARNYYNGNLPALKIFYGGYGGVDAKRIDKLLSEKIARAAFGRMNRLFHMPDLVDKDRLFFECRMAMLDSIWELSTRSFGEITEAYHQEAFAACVGYSRRYLPERLEPRDYLIAARSANDDLVLPFRNADEAA